MPAQEITRIPKAKLTITEIKPPEPIGDRGDLKLTFKAKDSEGKELTYFTFSKRLFPLIEAGKTVEADIEVSVREVGERVYTDRKLTEIYQEGQPVAGQRQGFAQRGGPEERGSIETQVAFKGAIELLTAKVIDLTHPFAQIAISWGIHKLGGVPPVPSVSQTAYPVVLIKPTEAISPPKPNEVPKTAKQISDEAGSDFEKVSEVHQLKVAVFFQCCYDHPQIRKNQTQVLNALNKSLKDLLDNPANLVQYWKDLKSILGVK